MRSILAKRGTVPDYRQANQKKMGAPKLGICFLCRFSSNCTLQAFSGDTFECSEYEAQAFFSKKNFVEAAAVQISTSKGLCVTCDEAENCQLSTRESVVFHCEQYS